VQLDSAYAPLAEGALGFSHAEGGAKRCA